ncbi:MAG: hypothetical protein HQK54_03290 [Oligoflexales bacterium]|nr:hypothetical protein [Oligoflexales bacterium]
MKDEIKCLETSLMLPSWWVHAFETTISSRSREEDIYPLELSCQSKLSPAFNLEELNALSSLLSTLQRQLLSGNEGYVLLDPEDHRRNVSSGCNSVGYIFERVLQSLSGIRLLAAKGKEGGFSAIPFFDGESWIKDDTSSDVKLKLRLNLAPLGAELLLGVFEPYTNMVRQIYSEFDIFSVFHDKIPLSVWRSVWLDFKGSEQLFLLRMEKALQWEYRFLRLDGVLGMSLKSIFKDIKVSRKKMVSNTVTLIEKLDFIDRIGQKLLDHGILSNQKIDKYLAINTSDENEVSLLWKYTQNRVFGDELKRYTNLAYSYLIEKVYVRNLDQIILSICGKLFDNSLRKQLVGIWEEIGKVEGEDKFPESVVMVKGNMPFFAPSLFFEWIIRQLPGHSFPLPDLIKNSEIGELAGCFTPKEVSSKYERFKNIIISEKDRYRQIFSEVNFTIASPQVIKSLNLKQLTSEVGNRVFLRNADIDKKSFNDQKATYFKVNQDKFDGDGKGKSNEKIDATQFRRLATQELNDMKKNDYSRYQEIKRLYMETLDSNSKEIIYEVQKRLQPNVFDDHLKYSLIKFMTENPRLWRHGAYRKQEIKN